MDAFVSTAIIGTGQQSATPLTTGTAVDALATQLPKGERERRLLLTAGAWSIYHKAGYTAAQAPDLPPPAMPEKLPSCSAGAALLIEDLLQNEYNKLLPDALQRLIQAQQRLPHKLLPQIFTVGGQSRALRSLIAAVSGERGHWLSHYNPAWNWFEQFLTDGDGALPADAESIWQEGTTGQRTQLLRRLRVNDPVKAHTWLDKVWGQEKAEVRKDFLTVFEVNLSPADEAFLEHALDDRSADVRSTASMFLARIPNSALLQRMLARGDSMLAYEHGKLSTTLPATLSRDWQRDGIVVDNKYHTLVQQILSLIPPDHWETRFAATPEQLLAASQDNAYAEDLLTAWSRAASLHHTLSWISPLVERWYALAGSSTIAAPKRIVQNLLAHLPQKEAESKAARIIFHEHTTDWALLLEALPHPWSAEFGEMCLQTLRDHTWTLNGNVATSWYTMLERASVDGLPEACFATALQNWEQPEMMHDTWYTTQWKNSLADAARLLRMRRRIYATFPEARFTPR